MFVFPPSPPPSGSGSSGSGSGSGSGTGSLLAESRAMVPMTATATATSTAQSMSFTPPTSHSGASAGAALFHTMQMQHMHMHQHQLQHLQHLHMPMPMLTTTPPPTTLSFPFPHHQQYQNNLSDSQSYQSSHQSPSPPSFLPYQSPSASVSPNHHQSISNSNSSNNNYNNSRSTMDSNDLAAASQQQTSQQPLAAAPVVPLPADLVRTVDPAGLGPSSVMPTATYVGYVEELADALYIFEGTQAGLLPRTTRRLTAAEKDRAVYHGAIHVFLERESGIKRWTDKLHWSASRIAGHFLMYREIEPATPAAKQAAAQAATAVTPGSAAAAKVRTPTSSTSTAAGAMAGPTPPRSPAVTGGAADNNADAASASSDPAEKPACPMARKSGYAIKSTGLIKRTVSLVYRGITHHLVSYFDESRLAELPRPRVDPRLNHLPICSEVKPLLKKAQGSAGQAAAAASGSSATTTATTVNGGEMQQLAAHAKRAAVDDAAEGVSTVNAGGAMYALESVVSHKRSRKARTSPSATTTAAAALSAIASQVSTPPQSPAQEPPAPEAAAEPTPPGPPPPAAIALPTHTSVFAPMPRSASSLSTGPQLVMDHTQHAQSSTPCHSPVMFDSSLPTSPTSPHWPSTSTLAVQQPSSMIAAAASASGLSEWAPAAPAIPTEGPAPISEYQTGSSPVVGQGVYHAFMSPPQQLDLWSPAAHSPALSFEDHPPAAAQPAWVFAALPPMIPNEASAAAGGWGPGYGNANVAAAIAANQFWASTAAAAAAQGAAGVFMAGPPPPPPPPHHAHFAPTSVPMLSPNTFAQVLASPDPAADAFMYLPAAHAVPPHLMGMVPMDSLSATGASAGTPASASPMMADASPMLSMQLDGMGIESPVMHGGEMGGLMFGPGQGGHQGRASVVMDLFATAPHAQQQQHQQHVEYGAGGRGGSTLSGLFSPVMSPTTAAGPTPSEFDVTAWLSNVASGTDEEDNQGKDKDLASGPEKQQR